MRDNVMKLLNEQINAEFYAAYIYLSMAAYFEDKDLAGFAHWMRMQSAEELTHAQKIFDYVIERGGRVVLEQIDAPPSDFDSPLDVFEKALAHEQKVTAMIDHLYAQAEKESDYPTQVMLQWFITEQVEEENTAGTLVAQLKMAGDSPAALLVFDRQLASR
ncbi:MAG: ferritin [Anaerolineae bacterium]